MKILAISDVHANENQGLYDYLKKNNLDLIIVSGDITNFGPLEFVKYFLNKLSAYGTTVLAIPGNCDPEEVKREIDSSNAINIHNDVFEYKNLVIYGFGGSNPTPFDTPGEMDEDTLYKSIKSLMDSRDIEVVKKATDDFAHGKIPILITHAPPKDTDSDKIENGAHVGSESVKKIIEEYAPRINLCGHIHEAKAFDMIDDTTIANPGMLENGYGTLIEIDDDNNIIANFVKLE
ncbi:MAG: metallophosphoesterase [Methanobrevibacter sp.]|nr:metallophosphoesterase [Methanobrevibacter sp.]